MPPPKKYRPGQGCRCHCSRCGRHFSSLKAFDAHLVEMTDETMIHLKPRNIPELQMKPEKGFCDLNPESSNAIGGRLYDIIIWEHVDADRARERFAAKEQPEPVKKAKATKKVQKSSPGAGEAKPGKRGRG